jgi:hypothetical protein
MITKKVGHLCKTLIILSVFACSFIQTSHAEGKLEVKNIKWDGFASYQFGQVVKGDYLGSNMEYAPWWNHQVLAGVGFDADLTDRMTVKAKIEGMVWHVYPGNLRPDWRRAKTSIWVDQACGTYKVDDPTNPMLSITAGYFIFKYNDEVRDLGEYLFRSGTYPGLLINSLDFPAARLLGFDFTTRLCDNKFKNDLMITEQSEVWPFGDISISDVASYNFSDIFKIGGGIELASLIPSSDKITTPRDPVDSTVDRVIDHLDSTGAKVYGTDYYTFKATKVMGHFSFDPKPLIGNSSIFGSEDCKFYGEIAVIGIKNYGFLYNKITERMPMMLGFNIPTFKILDCLSLECEYYSSPYLPDVNGILQEGNPLPFIASGATAWSSSSVKVYPWKWSVYIKKTLMPGITATFHVARDHFWPNYTDGYPSFNEALTQNGQWMWYMKLTGSL